MLFLVGSTLLPGLHLSFHQDDHEHTGGGLETRLVVAGDDDPELVLTVSVADGARFDHQHRHRPGLEHGEGSLAHFGLALGDGPCEVPGLAFLACVGEVSGARPEGSGPAAALLGPDVRGPPLLSV